MLPAVWLAAATIAVNEPELLTDISLWNCNHRYGSPCNGDCVSWVEACAV